MILKEHHSNLFALSLVFGAIFAFLIKDSCSILIQQFSDLFYVDIKTGTERVVSDCILLSKEVIFHNEALHCCSVCIGRGLRVRVEGC